MLTLILLRHTKAEAGSLSIADQDRALATRGRKDAARLGVYIVAQRLQPELVLVSPACRTRETWELAALPSSPDIQMKFEPLIYETTAARLLAIIRRTPATVKRLMLVGHNPGLEDLARDIMRDAEPLPRMRLERKYPTGGLAVLTFEQSNWSQIAPRSGHLADFTAPTYLD